MYLPDRRSQTTLIDVRRGGPGLDIVVSASPTLEKKVALRNVSDHDLLIDRYPDWEAAGKTAVAGDLYHWGVNPGGVDYVLDGLRIGGDYAGTEYVTPACGYASYRRIEELCLLRNIELAEQGEGAYVVEQALTLRAFLDTHPEALPRLQALYAKGLFEVCGAGEAIIDVNLCSPDNIYWRGLSGSHFGGRDGG